MLVENPDRTIVRALRAILGEFDTPFLGAKLMINRDDVLIIMYLRVGAILEVDCLEDLVSCLGTAAFVPHNYSVAEPHYVWRGNSRVVDSPCEPVY